jgi:SAM-dependent methyltransferase
LEILMPLASSRAGLRGLPSKLRYFADVLKKLNGVTARTCPICGYTGRFSAFGHPPRYDAECPSCTSLERHRLLYLAMQKEAVVSSTAEVLHFAPEQALTRFVRPSVGKYVTADLEEGRCDLALNLEKIALPDQSFDAVIANHVLEHVNDRTALRELWRILRPRGVLVITVPLIEGWDHTYEDDRLTTPRERDLHFGQWDHVRYYGRDFRDRLKAAGFIVTEFTASGADTVRFGLLRGERAFFARKG